MCATHARQDCTRMLILINAQQLEIMSTDQTTCDAIVAFLSWMAFAPASVHFAARSRFILAVCSALTFMDVAEMWNEALVRGAETHPA